MNFKSFSLFGVIFVLIVVFLTMKLCNDSDENYIRWNIQGGEKRIFSLDTIQLGDWTHFGIVFPYQDVESLISSRRIQCKEDLLKEIITLTKLDEANTMLFVKDDTLMFFKRVSRSMVQFSERDFGGLKMIYRGVKLTISKDNTIEIGDEVNTSK